MHLYVLNLHPPCSGFGKLVSCSSSGIVRVHACMDPDGAVGSSGRQWEQLASFQTCSNAACMVSAWDWPQSACLGVASMLV